MEWVLQSDMEDKTKKLAQLLGCTSNDDQEILGKLLCNQNIKVIKLLINMHIQNF